ncbi:MAG: hypothetical protein ABIZ04_24635 [Opitutus sp.]
MRILSLLLLGLGSLTAEAAPAPATARDFFIIANINRNYVVGSKIETVNGLYQKTADDGWQHIGVNDTTLTAVAFDPTDRQIIYTSGQIGLWRSRDGGRSWRLCNGWEMTEVRDVAVDPHSPQHVFVALPDGVAVSTNGGDTLVRREHGLPDRGKYTQAIEVDRTRAGRVLAACEVGLFLTEDAGEHWRQVYATKETVNDVQQSPHDPKRWIAVTQSAGALISADGGVSWSSVAGVPTDHALYNVTFDPGLPERLAIGSWAHGVMTSEDGGKTWQSRNAGLPEPHRVWRVGVDPRSRLYASVVDETLFVSDDFGRTWRADTLAGSKVNNFAIVPKANP